MQRRQAMFQLYLSDQQFDWLLRCHLYQRFYGNWTNSKISDAMWHHCITNSGYAISVVLWGLFLYKLHCSFTGPNGIFNHDDVIKWKHFPCYWPFVRGIHQSPVNCTHKGQWRGTLMFSLICAWTNGWVNNRGAGDLGRHRARYYVTLMLSAIMN